MLHFHFEPACGSGKKYIMFMVPIRHLHQNFYSPPKKIFVLWIWLCVNRITRTIHWWIEHHYITPCKTPTWRWGNDQESIAFSSVALPKIQWENF